MRTQTPPNTTTTLLLAVLTPRSPRVCVRTTFEVLSLRATQNRVEEIFSPYSATGSQADAGAEGAGAERAGVERAGVERTGAGGAGAGAGVRVGSAAERFDAAARRFAKRYPYSVMGTVSETQSAEAVRCLTVFGKGLCWSRTERRLGHVTEETFTELVALTRLDPGFVFAAIISLPRTHTHASA